MKCSMSSHRSSVSAGRTFQLARLSACVMYTRYVIINVLKRYIILMRFKYNAQDLNIRSCYIYTYVPGILSKAVHNFIKIAPLGNAQCIMYMTNPQLTHVYFR